MPTRSTFYKETGIALVAGKSKAAARRRPGAAGAAGPVRPTRRCFTLWATFSATPWTSDAAAEDYKSSYGADDVEGLMEHLAKVPRRAAAGYLEGFQAVVTAVKANEAILSSKRIELKPEWYELS